MKQMKRFTAVFICLFAFAMVKANNIQVTNVSTVVTGSVVQVEFDISWENSWRSATTNNWDGAWVFIKFKDNDGRWKHLNFTGGNLIVPSGFTTSFPANNSVPGVGMFIYRNSNGFGTVSLIDVRAGITPMPGTFDLKVFALEMVYIPQGGFYLGDGNTGGNRYATGNSTSPFQVNGPGSSITLGTGATNLKEPLDPSSTATLNSFPVGYNAFWVMKYELSQAAYRDFINSLTYEQQKNRLNALPNSAAGTPVLSSEANQWFVIVTPGVDPSVPAITGCDLDIDSVPNESNDGEWNIISGVNWSDAAAYLDWAGLRPATEIEFEKICRGPQTPVAGEYAWGTNQIATVRYNEVNPGTNSSAINNMSSTEGNAATSTLSPFRFFRNGIFATALSNRISAGAGYHGVMELSGNGMEYVVGTANIAGRSYTGIHGDGLLNATGQANENYWPGINGNTNGSVTPNGIYGGSVGVTANAGITHRGGSITSNAASLQVSQRNTTQAGSTFDGLRFCCSAIRGVHDAN